MCGVCCYVLAVWNINFLSSAMRFYCWRSVWYLEIILFFPRIFVLSSNWPVYNCVVIFICVVVINFLIHFLLCYFLGEYNFSAKKRINRALNKKENIEPEKIYLWFITKLTVLDFNLYTFLCVCYQIRSVLQIFRQNIWKK